jgi:MFS superfamily sulfate permease-like transporter
VGIIPQSLPSITLPNLSLAGQLLPGALGIALMSFTETIAAGRAFAKQTDPPIKPNRELLATGAANFAGAFFGAMPAGGGTSQTAVVRSVGGRTQKASLVTAAAAAATMLVLAPLLGLLPQAVLAAIVIVYSVGLIDPAEFGAIRNIRTMEFTWALAAFAGVLVFGTLQGIVVAIVLSLIGLSSQAANSKVYVIGRKRGEDVLRPVSPEHPDDETFDGLLIVRPEGRLFFANAQQVGDQIRALVAEHRPKVLAVDMSRVPDVEYSALKMLMDGEQRMTEEGITVWLAALNPSVLASIRSSAFADRLGPERLLFNARAAIRKHQERNDSADALRVQAE